MMPPPNHPDSQPPATGEVHTEDQSQASLGLELAKNSVIVFGGLTIGRVLRLVLQIIIGLILGPAGYGVYIMAHSAVEVLKSISALGFDRGGLRFTAIYASSGEREHAAAVARLAMVVTLTSSVVAALCIFIAAPGLSYALREPAILPALRLFSLGVPLLAIAFSCSGLLRGANHMALDTSVNEVLSPTLHIILLGCVLWLGVTLSHVIGAAVITAGLTAVVSVGLVWRLYPRAFSFNVPVATAASLGVIWSYSLAMLFVSFGNLAMRFDRLLLGGILSAVDVGLYGASTVIAQQNAFLLLAVNTVFAPKVAVLYNQKRIEDLRYIFKLLNRWTMAISVPFVIISILFAREILGLMGEGFEAGRSLLAIISLGQLVNSGTGSMGVLLNMSGNQRREILNTGLSVGVLIGGMILLVPRIGVVGGAIALASSLTAVNIVRVTQVYRLFGIHPFHVGMWRSLAAGVLVILAWLLFDGLVPLVGGARLIVGAALVGSLYAFPMLKWGLQPEDRALLASMLSRVDSSRKQ